MKKALVMIAATLFFSSCANQFNRVLKSTDMPMKYEYAKEYFATGKYNHAITLLNDLISFQKGTDNAQ